MRAATLQVLSDDGQRKIYDRLGEAGLKRGRGLDVQKLQKLQQLAREMLRDACISHALWAVLWGILSLLVRAGLKPPLPALASRMTDACWGAFVKLLPNAMLVCPSLALLCVLHPAVASRVYTWKLFTAHLVGDGILFLLLRFGRIFRLVLSDPAALALNYVGWILMFESWRLTYTWVCIWRRRFDAPSAAPS